MNEQKEPGGIEWTRIRETDGTRRKGYTWNPVSGCLHDCHWQLPNGKIVKCYAKGIAENIRGSYPYGFDHHYWNPERLEEPRKLKTPAGIFVDSMGDLFGRWVPTEQVNQVLKVCRDTPDHIYMILTKNAPRLIKFDYPPNVWIGVSSPPDMINGQWLNQMQRNQMLRISLEALRRTNASVKFMSFEPLSWDVSGIVDRYSGILNWAIIGGGSDGSKYYAPLDRHLRWLLAVLDDSETPVFFKGNLDSSQWALDNWRQAFPPVSRTPETQYEQRTLF